MLTSGNTPAFDADQQIAARGEVANLLVGQHVDVVLAEWSICTPVGDDEVMSGQLRHLQQLSEQPNITLRVLSSGRQLDLSRHGGFAVLDFTDHLAVIYREDYTTGTLTDDHLDISVFKSIAAALSAASLNEQLSSDITGRATIALHSSARP